MTIAFSVKWDHDDTCGAGVGRAHGDLDVASREALVAAVRRRQPGTVRLDLEGVSFIDSSGLSALIELARDPDRPLRIVAASASVGRLLDLTDTWEVLTGRPASD